MSSRFDASRLPGGNFPTNEPIQRGLSFSWIEVAERGHALNTCCMALAARAFARALPAPSAPPGDPDHVPFAARAGGRHAVFLGVKARAAQALDESRVGPGGP